MEKMIKKIIGMILVLLLSGTLIAQDKAFKGRTYPFKIGILYSSSPTGKRFRNGINEAIATYSQESINIFKTYDFPYDNETEGLEILRSLLKISDSKKNQENKVDIILGPTDSGVFERALEQCKELEKAKIPVISSRVAANIAHQEGGWFFRTDINVQRRAQVIGDVLNKYWIRSIAILYEETDFGKRAEQAFRQELQGMKKKHYLPLSYSSTEKAQSQIQKILEQRPEAVGFFGDERTIALFNSSLKKENTGWSRYLPLTFSIAFSMGDTRSIQDNLYPRDHYVVSAVDITKHNDFDDVNALAVDTTILILGELDALAESEKFEYDDPSWRQSFRNHFEAILYGNRGSKRDNSQVQSITRLSFKKCENNTPLNVFKVSQGVTRSILPGKTITITEKIGHKLALTWNRFGFPIVFNILLVFIVVLLISIADIRRWYTGKWLLLFKSVHFGLLFITNLTIALVIYFFLGETGHIRYDSYFAAFILSLTPSAIFRTTFFRIRRSISKSDTSESKAIGLAAYYDFFLLWVYDHLTLKPFLKHPIFFNVIAYNKSAYDMKCLLEDTYQGISNRDHRIRMRARMEEVLKKSDSGPGTRRSLARLLIQKPGWDELEKIHFVPKWFELDKIDLNNPPPDPEEMVSEAARYCLQNPGKKKIIEKRIQDELKKLPPERRKALEIEHEKEKSEMRTPKTIMEVKITFLFHLHGYDPDFLKTIGCFPG